MSLKAGQSGLLLIFLIMSILLIILGLYNLSKTGSLLGDGEYKRVELVELLSFGNFYSGKKICTRGYYVKDYRLSIIRVNLKEDELITRSAWVRTPNEDIITSRLSTRYVEAELCGFFESKRGSEFGDPSVWNQQITVEKYKLYSQPAEINIQ